MPDATPIALANEVREATLRVLWRQWRAIGASVSNVGPANALVDPEALLLMSLWMFDHERRLSDIAVSWTQANSQLLSIQRLRNLRPAFPVPVSQRLSALAAIAAREAKDARWNSLRGRTAADLGLRTAKPRAIEVRVYSWATLLLQLRRGMGVGAKADVLACVLGLSNVPNESWASVSTIATAVGYTPTSVRNVSDDLAGARFIRSLDMVGGERSTQRLYSGDAKPWATLLRIGTHQPGWIYWKDIYLILIDLMAWLEALEKKPMSEYAQDVGARDILVRHGTSLLRDRILDQTDFAGAELDMAYLGQVWRQLANWLDNHA
jgi:hypothetical protein